MSTLTVLAAYGSSISPVNTENTIVFHSWKPWTVLLLIALLLIKQCARRNDTARDHSLTARMKQHGTIH